MRTLKISLLIASLALISMRCGDNKPKPDAWKSITKNKFVRIATNPFTVPFESAAGYGIEGFDADLGEAICKDIGYPVRWVKVTDSYEKMFEDLDLGSVEMIISAVAITPEREQKYAFSIPYFEGNNTIAHRNDNEQIKDLASLSGKRVGVQTGRIADQFMTNQKTAANVTLSRYKTLEEALGYLNRQEIDAVVGDNQVMTYSIAKNYKTNLITTGVEFAPTGYAVVTRPQETKLLSKINETIKRLQSTNELKGAMHDKWFGKVLDGAKGDLDAIAARKKLEISPKTLSVVLIKELGNTTRLDRLDGFNATITGANGTFTSTAINSNEAGDRGSFKFNTPIPPGEYKFNLSRIGVSQAITIDKVAKGSLTVTLTFTKNGSLMLDVR